MAQIRLSPSKSKLPSSDGLVEPRSLTKDAWLRLRKNRLAMFGLIFFTCITILSFLGPLFYQYSPESISLSLGSQPPFTSVQLIEVRFDEEKATPDEVITTDEFVDIYANDPEADLLKLSSKTQTNIIGIYFKRLDRFHILGTDTKGRDTLARIIQGGRISLGVGFVATIVAILIGVTYGSISGYIGGKVDAFMMRLVDILYALPFLIFVILLMITFQDFDHQLILIFIAIGAVEWLTMARIVRGQVNSIKNMDFVEAARANGVPTASIIVRHLAPNILGPVIVYATLLVPAVMLLESTLSFLGLGIQEPSASWGTLIKDGADRMASYPWLLIVPSLFFSLTLFAMNFLGDGLRDALDVKSSKD